MKKVNSLSGGGTSSYMAANYPADYEVFSLVCIDDFDCHPKDKSLVQYVNAKLEKFVHQYGEFIATAEDDKTLEVMMDLEQYLGREIIWVRGKSYDDVIDLGTQNRLPSWARRYCTTQMKLQPIFDWWFNSIGEKCDMRIGFRFDEFERVENFWNNSDPTNFKIPVSCSTRGQRLQRHETFNWRQCKFPLVKDGITKDDVKDYWKGKTIGGNLFEPLKEIKFPIVSNCVGCFHKDVSTLIQMAALHPDKMKWFANQEDKGMGTWLDSRVKYQSFVDYGNDLIFDERNLKTCDSGGCTA